VSILSDTLPVVQARLLPDVHNDRIRRLWDHIEGACLPSDFWMLGELREEFLALNDRLEHVEAALHHVGSALAGLLSRSGAPA
jgi:hypothetical protein